MYFKLKDSTAKTLASSRRHDELCNLPLDLIATEQEAYDIQAAAQSELGFERVGCSIVGSSEEARTSLGLTRPIYSDIPALALTSVRDPLRLPPATIGAQCELLFTLGQPFPGEGQITIDSALKAIESCRPAIGILARRTGRAFAGDNAAIADFGLHAATMVSDEAISVDPRGLSNFDVTAFLFREGTVLGRTSFVMGNPLNAVVWLAQELSLNGQRPLQPGDVIATGGCTKILRVHAGQHLAVDFGPLGQVDCVFA